MVLEQKFIEEARKLIGLHHKLTQAHASGKVSNEKYIGYRENFGVRLSDLRKLNLEFIDDRILEASRHLSNLRSQKTSGLLSDSTHYSMSIDLNEELSELEAEREIVKSCTDEEYILYIKKQLETISGYGRKTTFSVIADKAAPTANPAAPSSTILVLATGAVIIGYAYGSFRGLFIALALSLIILFFMRCR